MKNSTIQHFEVFIFCFFSLFFSFGIAQTSEHPLSAPKTAEIRGDGSKENPFLIGNSVEMDIMRMDIMRSNTSGKYYKQIQDINLGGKTPGTDEALRHKWVSMGNEANPFEGHFDGNGYEIQSMYAVEDGESSSGIMFCKFVVGLFGYVEVGAELVNITIDSLSEIKVKPFTDIETSCHIYIGSIAAFNRGSIISCVNYASINLSAANARDGTPYNYKCGGIAGESVGGSIFNSENHGNIYVEESNPEININFYCGGITGSGHIIKGCRNFGDIDATNANSGNTAYIGGIAYQCNEIFLCGNQGNIKFESNSRTFNAHGLARLNWADDTIAWCYNTGDIQGIGIGSACKFLHVYNVGNYIDMPIFWENSPYVNSEYINTYYLKRGDVATKYDTCGEPLTLEQFQSEFAVNALNGNSSAAYYCLDKDGENKKFPIFRKAKIELRYIDIPNPYTDTIYADFYSRIDFDNIGASGYKLAGVYTDPVYTQVWLEENLLSSDIVLYPLLLNSWDDEASDSFAGGDGSNANPYLISTAQQLAHLSVLTNSSSFITKDKYYQLTNDIDLGGQKLWTPIGSADNTEESFFYGTFDGGEYQIKGLYVRQVEGSAGLFGNILGATIRNLSIDSSSDVVTLGDMAGSVVGRCAGRLEGYEMSLITNVHSACKVKSNNYAGGILGYSSYRTTLSYSSFYGEVYGNTAGGLVGCLNHSNSIYWSYNRGEVVGVENAAGILGFNENSYRTKFKSLYSQGEVLSSSGIRAPLFIGTIPSVEDCYYTNRGNFNVERIEGIKINVGILREPYMLEKLNKESSPYAFAYDLLSVNDGFPIINNKKIAVTFDNSLGIPIESRKLYTRLTYKENDLPEPYLNEADENIRFKAWRKSTPIATDTVGVDINTYVGEDDIILYSIWVAKTLFAKNINIVLDLPPYNLVLGTPYLGVTLPAPQIQDANFYGWAFDSTLLHSVEANDIVAESLTLYPMWQVEVDFNAKGGDSIGNLSYVGEIAYGDIRNPELPTPSKIGYEFGGWYANLDNIFSNQRYATSIVPLILRDTLYASWIDRVMVSFETFGRVEAISSRLYYPSRKYFDDRYNKQRLPDLPNDTCKFKSWINQNGNTIDDNDIVEANNHILYSQYMCPVTVRFEFNEENGSSGSTREFYTTLSYNESWMGTSNPGVGFHVPSRDEYTFDGWHRDKELTEEVTNYSMVGETDTVLYAKWQGIKTVTFKAEGGNAPSSKTYYIGYSYFSSGEINKRNNGFGAGSKGDAIFQGWYADANFTEEITRASEVTAEHDTLYALFGEKHTIRFETNGGRPVDTMVYYTYFGFYEYDRASQRVINTGLPPVYRSSQDSLKFGGWYIEPNFETLLTDDSKVSPDYDILYAKWGPAYQKVSFVTNDINIVENDRTYKVGDDYYDHRDETSVPLPYLNPSDGNTFLGWYATADFSFRIDNNTIVEAGIDTLYAKWGPTYQKVSFVTNDINIVENDRTYKVGDDYYDHRDETSVPLPHLTSSDGNTFLGWYATADFSFRIDNNTRVEAGIDTLYAKWSKAVNITFIDLEDIGSTETKVYRHNIPYSQDPNTGLSSPKPVTPPYIFGGWFSEYYKINKLATEDSIALLKPHTMYARWCIRVMFETFGGLVVEDVLYSPSITYEEFPNTGIPDDPTRRGYSFDGWFSDAGFMNIVSDTTIVSETNHTLYAKWTEIPATMVTVSFNTNGGDVILAKVYEADGLKYGELPNTGLPIVVRDGYFFGGWFNSAGLDNINIVSDSTVVPQVNHTLFVKWVEVPITMVTVSFNTNGGNEILAKVYEADGLQYGELPNEGLPTAVRKGYSFDGWFSDIGLANIVSDLIVVPQTDHTLYAKWTEIPATMVTVSFNTNGGDAVQAKVYEADGLKYGELPNTGLPIVVRDGYFFGGWFSSAGLDNINIVSDSTIVPQVNHTLFVKWVEVPITMVTVSFNTNGGDVISARVYEADGLKYGESPNDGLPTAVRDGYSFDGWFSDVNLANIVDDLTVVHQTNHTLYAKWTEIPATMVTVSFNTNGGDVISARVYEADGLMYGEFPNGGLPAAVRVDYFFGGWFSDAALENIVSDLAIIPQTDHTLYAKWSEVAVTMVTVSFNTNGGDVISARVYEADGLKYGESPNDGLPTAVRDGYLFGGWFSDAALANLVTDLTIVPQVNHILYAKWTEEAVTTTVTVSFNTNGGDVISARVYEADGLKYGESPNNGLPTAVRDGYSFGGWFSDVNLASIVSDLTIVPQIDHNLYAKWTDESVTTVTVSFNTNGGDEISARIYEADGLQYGESPNNGLPTAVRDGYSFDGWFSDVSLASIVSDLTIVPQENHTLYAKWTEEAATTVTVSFNTNGGDEISAKVYEADGLQYGESPNDGLPTAVRDGSLFGGWFSDAMFNTKIDNSSIVPSYNHTLYAKWGTVSNEDEITLSEVKIFPNPVSDILFIQTDKKIDKIQLINKNGVVVLSKLGNHNVLDISSFANGIYFLLITTEDGRTEHIKIVKI